MYQFSQDLILPISLKNSLVCTIRKLKKKFERPSCSDLAFGTRAYITVLENVAKSPLPPLMGKSTVSDFLNLRVGYSCWNLSYCSYRKLDLAKHLSRVDSMQHLFQHASKHKPHMIASDWQSLKIRGGASEF